MLVGGFFYYSNTQDFLSKAVVTEGTVTKLVGSKFYNPVVEFKTQSGRLVKFTSSFGSNPPSYSEGEVVEVIYQETSPEQARIKDFFSLWGVSIIFGGIGFVFFLIGIVIISVSVLKDKKIKYLKRNGIPVIARFQSVEVNNSLKVNGKKPYQICAHWQDPVTSELHIFNSENLWFDPTDYIKQSEITVLIEKDNPKNYYVDISFLPKVAS